jgi:formate-nitrite transporter family protein
MNAEKRGWREPQGQRSEPDEKKSYREILEDEIEAGLIELRRPAQGLFLSGLSAGLDVGFGILAMAVIVTLATGELPEVIVRILEANTYTIGFTFVILGRSELFTEHTTLAALPVLDGRAGVGRLLRLWGVVYASNTLGAIAFATAVALVLPALGSATAPSFAEIATRLVDHPAWVIFCSAILAGWLMGLLSWLVTAARDTTGKLLMIWLVTGVIGLAGLHHCIAGTVEVVAGVIVDPGIGALDAVRTLGLATLGNAVGGFVFVALVKYGHASGATAGDG